MIPEMQDEECDGRDDSCVLLTSLTRRNGMLSRSVRLPAGTYVHSRAMDSTKSTSAARLHWHSLPLGTDVPAVPESKLQ